MAVKDSDGLVERLAEAEATLREASQALARARGLHAPHDEAVRAFAEAAAEVLGDRPLSVAAARRGAILAAAAEAWEGELGPLLSSAQVRDLLGDVSRQRVDELLRARRLIGLRDAGGRRRFPAIQFHDGRPLPALVAAFWTLADAAADDWTAAAWLVAPDDALDGRAPVAWVREGHDEELLLRVARQDAARLAR